MRDARRSEIDQDKLLATDDATVWSNEFVRVFSGGVIGDDIDVGLMTGWFAGAIETAKTLDRKRRRKS